MTFGLPAVLEEIAEVAGVDAAWTIAHAKGGQQVFIPADAPSEHWLTKLVGRDAAQKICDHFRANGRGDDILIPMASAARRREAWQRALESGGTANQTASVLGVHRRTVFRHRKRQRNEDQGDLF